MSRKSVVGLARQCGEFDAQCKARDSSDVVSMRPGHVSPLAFASDGVVAG